MTETVENKVCDACGVDVRPESLFCYNCGGAVGEKKNNASLPERAVTEQADDDKTPQIEQSAIEKVSDKPIPKPDIQQRTKLKSAADFRRKSKILQKTKVEVVWEEHENAPNVWFISVAVLLILAAAGLLFLAAYFK